LMGKWSKKSCIRFGVDNFFRIANSVGERIGKSRARNLFLVCVVVIGSWLGRGYKGRTIYLLRRLSRGSRERSRLALRPWTFPTAGSLLSIVPAPRLNYKSSKKASLCVV
jgi:hypothetical protein